MIKYNHESGFTIIELMIAISLLAIILLMSSLVMMGIGSLYTKGIDMANVQNTSRNIIEDLTSTIQFSGEEMQGPNIANYTVGGSTITVSAICFGSTRYSYFTGFPPANVNLSQIMWQDTMTSQDSCSPLDIAQSPITCNGNTKCLSSVKNSGSELVGTDMHISGLSINRYNPQLYGINLGLAYGFENMFETKSNGHLLIKNGHYICNTGSGQQYCATSSLSTLATERVN